MASSSGQERKGVMYKAQEQETCLLHTPGDCCWNQGTGNWTQRCDQKVRMGSTEKRNFVRWIQSGEQKPKLAGRGDGE